MRVGIVSLMLLPMVAALIAQAACAEVTGPINIGVPFVAGPGFTLAAPFSQGCYLINVFNTSTLACTDTESLAISLAPATSGSATGGFTLSPIIAQNSAQTMVMDRCYFFNDFISGA